MTKSNSPSGKFIVRLPKSLHAKLSAIAECEGVSLNHFVLAVLAERMGAYRLTRVEPEAKDPDSSQEAGK